MGGGRVGWGGGGLYLVDLGDGGICNIYYFFNLFNIIFN